MLTRKDLQLLVTEFSKLFVTKDESKTAFSEIAEKISHLPTKDEFFARMDKLSAELKKSRENQDAISHRHTENGKRLDKIEDILNIPHAP